ncbi:RNA ligase family protein [Streptomyces sp. NRRL S-15]|uniref:RNA ligase family protein n=1 Tax=Streptomyces sp. NRRL S-15 TaxID=1463886 RepID=UPI0004CBAA4C|nr:RNA ligase family protein [Streptomyces sp. NRRL S-15]
MTIPYLAALNTATKYPSIPTYHTLDPKNGGLLDQPARFEGDVILTEKIDGTNGRIVLLPDGDYFIGSREELLYAKGDRIENPALSIVEALKPLAERLKPRDEHGQIAVFFLEVYGRKIGGAAKQYTSGSRLGARLFDIACLLPDVLDWPREQISTWREGGGQRFCTEATLQRAAEAEAIEMAPRLETVPAATLPTDIEGMAQFLAGRLPVTRVALDEGAGHQPEGIVLRSADRSVIAKARFQDYARTLKRRANRR